MDEVQIADIQDLWKKFQELDKRREVILTSIEEQGKLTPELRAAILAAATMTELEDLYLPYRPKRKTRATMAIERGLEPLAKRIFPERSRRGDTCRPVYHRGSAHPGRCPAGTRDIIAEWVNEDKKARDRVRRHFEKGAIMASKVAKGKEADGPNTAIISNGTKNSPPAPRTACWPCAAAKKRASCG